MRNVLRVHRVGNESALPGARCLTLHKRWFARVWFPAGSVTVSVYGVPLLLERLDVMRHATAATPEREHEWEREVERERERETPRPLERAPLLVFYCITVVFVTTGVPYVCECRSGTAGQSNRPRQPSGPKFVNVSGGFDSLPFTSLLLSFGMAVHACQVAALNYNMCVVCVCVCVCVFCMSLLFFSPSDTRRPTPAGQL